MLGLAAPSLNSLRSLRSLRSDNATSQITTRAAREGRKPCASRRSRYAPQPARQRLGWNLSGSRRSFPRTSTLLPRCARAALGVRGKRRGAQWAWPRAQRASLSDPSRLSERRERSEQSEFRDAAMPASTAGESERSGDRFRRTPSAARVHLGRSERRMNERQQRAENGQAHQPRRTRRSSSRISSMAPTVMALSATLNDGKYQPP